MCTLNKKKVKVCVSVTYSKFLEVEVEEPYTKVDLINTIENMGILPNAILQKEKTRLRKLIKNHENTLEEDFKRKLIHKRDICTPWHEDELEVIEDEFSTDKQ